MYIYLCNFPKPARYPVYYRKWLGRAAAKRASAKAVARLSNRIAVMQDFGVWHENYFGISPSTHGCKGWVSGAAAL